MLEQAIANTGAVIVGRRTYDDSLPGWGADGPTGSTRLPTFVLTHREQPPPPADSVYTFVTDGPDSVVKQAKEVAGDKDVSMSELASESMSQGDRERRDRACEGAS